MSSVSQPRLPLGKTCTGCKEWLPFSRFYRHPKAKDGFAWRCKSCLDAKTKAWRLTVDPEKQRELHRVRSRRYYEGHKAEHAARVKRWTESHRRADCDIQLRRSARLKANGGSYTPEEWTALLVRHGGRCLCCGTTEEVGPDHVVPVALGGSSDIGNIQPLCRTCNMRKFTQTTDYRPPGG